MTGSSYLAQPLRHVPDVVLDEAYAKERGGQADRPDAPLLVDDDFPDLLRAQITLLTRLAGEGTVDVEGFHDLRIGWGLA